MREERLNLMTFFYDYDSIEYLRITYSHTLKPINGDDMWEKGPGEIITSPFFKAKKKTTCKFKRRPEIGEKSKGSISRKAKKDGVKIHCSNFGGEGHNKTTCTQRPSKLKVYKQFHLLIQA